jgi:hypothetical protein
MKIKEIYESADYEDSWDDELVVPDGVDDSEDEFEEPAGDAESDSFPHILMQLKKAVDVDGNYPVKFKDGTEHKLDLDDIISFVEMYMEVKPDAKELMQTAGAKSKENFDKIVEFYRSSMITEHGKRCWTGYERVPGKKADEKGSCRKIQETKPKGLYYNVNKRKKAGTSRPKGHPDAPTDQAWKDAAKTAKK